MNNRRKVNIDGVRTSTTKRRLQKARVRKVRKTVVDTKAPAKERLKQRLPQKKEVSFASNRKRRKKIPGFVIPTVLALIVVSVLINQFDSAVIRVQPMVEQYDIEERIVTVSSGTDSRLEFSVIAFTETQEVEVEPDTEEQVFTKASGTIRIFNDYSTEPQRLSPETRFESVDGKIFMLGDEGVVIPGKEGDVPGELIATVYAQEPGSSYNIDVTDFSIPGYLELGLEERYTSIYALSTEAFTGGSEGTEMTLSSNLKEQQTRDLEAKIQARLEERLLSEKTERMALVENSVSIVFGASEYQDGKLSQTGSIYALLVNQEELASYLAKDTVENAKEGDVRLLPESNLNLVYTGPGPIDYQDIQQAQIDVRGNAYFVWNINQEKIAESFRGVAKKDIQERFLSHPSLGSVRITNHPRWRSRLPLSEEDIRVQELAIERESR